MATVFTQAASPLKLNLHAPKPASRFDDLSFDPMDASPLPARGLAAAGCVQAMPPRRSTSSARAPLVCASLTSEATLHRRGRAPPRRGTKVILTDLRKHDDLNGEVGFIVFKPDDRFDGELRYRVLLRDHPDIVFAKGSNLLVDTCAPCAARRFTRAPAAQYLFAPRPAPPAQERRRPPDPVAPRLLQAEARTDRFDVPFRARASPVRVDDPAGAPRTRHRPVLARAPRP